MIYDETRIAHYYYYYGKLMLWFTQSGSTHPVLRDKENEALQMLGSENCENTYRPGE